MKTVKRAAEVACLIACLAGSACARPSDDGAPHATADVASAQGATAASVVYRVPVEGAPVLGDVNAPVTIVAFTDYECPFCVRAESIVGQLRKAYGAKVRVVMRQMPLPIHPHARAAATAAVAAGNQGKFWQMHERLFASSRSLDEETIEKLATELGVDVARFRADRALADATVDRDQAIGSALGVKGTPTFFINGRRIAGAQPIETWRPVIDEEIAKASALVGQGTKPEDVYASLTKNGVERAPEPAKGPTPAVAAAAAPAAAASGAPCGQPEPEPAGNCNGDDDKVDSDVVEEVDVSNAPVRGDVHAPVTIAVFSDFQCPYCVRGEATVKALLDAYGDRVRVAWRNMPLPMHASARQAAKAALAAGQQGKFWEYHDALFAHQDALDADALERYARDLGLDVTRFRAALADPALEASIAADEAAGHKLGVTGTPTFFVNGRRIQGAQPIALFRTKVDQALAGK